MSIAQRLEELRQERSRLASSIVDLDDTLARSRSDKRIEDLTDERARIHARLAELDTQIDALRSENRQSACGALGVALVVFLLAVQLGFVW